MRDVSLGSQSPVQRYQILRFGASGSKLNSSRVSTSQCRRMRGMRLQPAALRHGFSGQQPSHPRHRVRSPFVKISGGRSLLQIFGCLEGLDDRHGHGLVGHNDPVNVRRSTLRQLQIHILALGKGHSVGNVETRISEQSLGLG